MKKVIINSAKFAVRAALHPSYGSEQIKLFRDRRLINKKRYDDYIEWFDKHKATEEQLDRQRKVSKDFKYRPLISILLPTYNTNPTYLRSCIDSVLSQSYDNWELCISDDNSTSEQTKDVIKEYVEKYGNVIVTFRKENGHISKSSNTALSMAKGDYISLLDHDDILPPNALFEVVNTINKNPEVDLIYTDEDKIDREGNHIEPFFKPDWSPDFMNSCNMITHFATMKTNIIRRVNGFTVGTHGAQDWDLFLKITAKTNNIYHIPKILYHWRKSETSTAMNADSKPYAYINQRRVLRSSARQRSDNAYIDAHTALGFWRKKYVIPNNPLVSIIIPTKDNFTYIKNCVESIIEDTTYPYFEIVIVDTGSTDKRVKDFYKKLTSGLESVTIVNYKKKFNFSDACNQGAKASRGEYLLFLNNDTKVITHDWIQALLEHAQRPEIGMVGPKLLFEDKTIQHAGIVLSERDIAFHPFYGEDQRVDIFTYIYTANIRNVSAVTAACSMVSRKKFDEVGGFDPKLRVTYNDVDLNLKRRKKGYYNLYTPYAELFHYESKSVGRINTSERDSTELQEAQNEMRKRWGDYLKRDPFYNDNFEQFGPGYRLPK